jgi:hypothetical protein
LRRLRSTPAPERSVRRTHTTCSTNCCSRPIRSPSAP